MELFLELTDQTIHDPSAVEIADAFLQDNQFLILSAEPGPDSLTYMQFHSSDARLEYQDGSIDRHFRALDDPTFEQIIAAFQKYARGDESWRDDFRWQREVIE